MKERKTIILSALVLVILFCLGFMKLYDEQKLLYPEDMDFPIGAMTVLKSDSDTLLQSMDGERLYIDLSADTPSYAQSICCFLPWDRESGPFCKGDAVMYLTKIDYELPGDVRALYAVGTIDQPAEAEEYDLWVIYKEAGADRIYAFKSADCLQEGTAADYICRQYKLGRLREYKVHVEIKKSK